MGAWSLVRLSPKRPAGIQEDLILKIQTIRERLLAGTMIGGVALAAAVALPAAAVMLAPTSASAQDYTTGALSGTIVDENGSPVSGASVQISSNEQGFSRTVAAGANGAFRVPLVPLGSYTVTVSANGYQTTSDPNVTVRLGGNSAYTFTLNSAAAAGADLGEIVVTASRPELDFAQTTTGATINVAELVKEVPIGRNITSVALLAPRVIPGDSAFGNQPSLGGSSVAENAFYINGLNITDFNTYVGAVDVPFDFYRTVEVKTGGYPAEFGRATGGILNAVTKSGTNDFMFALHGNWNPSDLREESRMAYNSADAWLTDVESWQIAAEIGGPIIKDRLYAYGLYQWQDFEQSTFSSYSGTASNVTYDDPFWGVKLDGYITEGHHLEFTYFDTSVEQLTLNRTFTDTDGDGFGDTVGANVSSGTRGLFGGENWVARYTGNFTDWLTVSAAYGINENRADSFALDTDTTYARNMVTGAFLTTQRSLASQNQSTKREFYRFDADLNFDWNGAHHVRLGMDNEDTELVHGLVVNGQAQRAYQLYGSYVRVLTENMGGRPVDGQNRAFYIQDSWDLTDQLNLQIGLRHDQFILNNLAGQQVIDLKNNWGPRFAFSLDPFGEGRDKFYASYGRYFIPPASNLSFRGSDDYYWAYYRYATDADGFSVNADGTANGIGVPFVGGSSSFRTCPTSAGYGAAGTVACQVYGTGEQEPADSKYAYGTKATNEDEFIVGYQRQVNDLWSVGAAVTYRKLNNVSEDVAVDSIVNAYCESQGMVCDAPYAGNSLGYFGDYQYIIMNPGKDVSFLVRSALPDGSRPVLTVSAAEMGLPKAKREYAGLELTFERAFDGRWSLNGSYALSKSIGNYEGTVLSDNGQDDAGSTILYDHTGLMDGAYGLLPNHRAHQFKLYGSYRLFDNFTVGANLSVISPRHFACQGSHPTDPDAAGYGASSFYCPVMALDGTYANDNPDADGYPQPTSAAQEEYVLSPRGSTFRSDWETKLDLSFRYTLPAFGGMSEGLVLRADVFNVFNTRKITNFNNLSDYDVQYDYNVDYGKPTSFQAPRSVRVGFDLQF